MLRIFSLLAVYLVLVNQYAFSASLIRKSDDINEGDHSGEGGTFLSRSLLSILSNEFSDPKTVRKKETFDYPTKDNAQRPLNILAFGGSQTWGAQLQNRHEAYPWLIGHPSPHHVDNLATRATGADYPSVCLETMIPRNHAEGRATYDLILVEFVLNGTNGLTLLLRRLRDIYPDAVIVYVGLWSLLSCAMESGTEKTVRERGRDPSANWVWKAGDIFSRSTDPNRDCFREICTLQKIRDLLESVGGYVFEFPRPDTPRQAITEGWFVDDWHHFSEKGHRLIADNLIRFLSEKHDELFKNSKRFNAEIFGDQCYNWFETGRVDLPFYDGGVLKNLATTGTNTNEIIDNNKWVLEIDPINGAKIEFHSKFDSTPIGLAYMSRQEPAKYPKVEISLRQKAENPVVIDPNINRVVWMKVAHITTFTQVGLAKLGVNTLFITPLEQTDEPFRIVGIYICGYCANSEMGGNNMANGEKNNGSDARGSGLVDEARKERKSDSNHVAVQVKTENNADIAAVKSKKNGDWKDVYYGKINNRYREEDAIDVSKLPPRETLPPLAKNYGDMTSVDDVAVQFGLEGNF